MHSTEVAFLLLTKQLQVRFLALPKTFSGVAEIYQWCWLEEKGQWLENGDRTYVALACQCYISATKKVSSLSEAETSTSYLQLYFLSF